MRQKQKFLLLEDIHNVGRMGEVISVRPGFARNYLVPLQKAIAATPHTLRKQELLQQERAKKAVLEKQEAELIAAKIEGLSFQLTTQVDQAGHMYGSVSVADVINLFADKELALTKKNFSGDQFPLKKLGSHKITLTFKEGVTSSFVVEVIPA